ncbi:hypothetical protein [Nitratifractor sp.]
MYHYLKWAALSLFFKRNLRYLMIIAVSLIGLYGIDALYRDFVDYFVQTGQRGYLLPLLLIKWGVVVGLIVLLLYSIMRLGFGRETEKRSFKPKFFGKERSGDKGEEADVAQEDAMMARLEKFRYKGRLRRKSDLLMERKKGKR